MNLALRHVVVALLALCAWLAPSRTEASTSCSASMSNVSFGSIDPFGGSVDVTATITYNCSTSGLLGIGLRGARLRMCFGIGSGVNGGGAMNPRRMTGGVGPMSFQLYKDPARTQIWGTRADAYGAVQVDLEYSALIGSSSGGGTLTVYGRVPSGQTTLSPASYSNPFSGVQTEWIFNGNEGLLNLTSFPASCSSGGSQSGNGAFPFTASASVDSRCNPTFSVEDVDFGTHGLLKSAIDTTATVSPQCTQTTPYQIGLDNGQNALGGTRRMRSPAGHFVSYELYRDNAHTLRWGNTLNSDTVNQTGSGTPQSTTVYGRVPAQTSAPAGNYADTVTVTITY
ncbi:MAG TPA: spore coat protein U domain-containing protein [Fontimonas sp.]